MSVASASLLATGDSDTAAALTWPAWKNRVALAHWQARVAAHARGLTYPDPRDERAQSHYARIALRAAWLRGERLRVMGTG